MLVDIVYHGVRYEKYKYNLATDEVISYYKKNPRVLKQHFGTTGRYYMHLNNDGKMYHIPVHRLKYQMHHPNEDIQGKEIDHEDVNKVNNELSNLRIATHGQNNANRPKCRGNNEYIGVFKKHGKWWEYQLRVENVIYRKHFLTKKEALEARNAKIKELGVEQWYAIQCFKE